MLEVGLGREYREWPGIVNAKAFKCDGSCPTPEAAIACEHPVLWWKHGIDGN